MDLKNLAFLEKHYELWLFGDRFGELGVSVSKCWVEVGTSATITSQVLGALNVWECLDLESNTVLETTV